MHIGCDTGTKGTPFDEQSQQRSCGEAPKGGLGRRQARIANPMAVNCVPRKGGSGRPMLLEQIRLFYTGLFQNPEKSHARRHFWNKSGAFTPDCSKIPRKAMPAGAFGTNQAFLHRIVPKFRGKPCPPALLEQIRRFYTGLFQNPEESHARRRFWNKSGFFTPDLPGNLRGPVRPIPLLFDSSYINK
jgi:hypothetical protein